MVGVEWNFLVMEDVFCDQLVWFDWFGFIILLMDGLVVFFLGE